MPHRILYHTWSIRTISPFAIPLFSSGVRITAIEDQLTSFVRRKTSNEEGTYVTLAWIALSDSQKHLHLHIRLQDEAAANLLLCFPTFVDTTITRFSYVMQRGSKAICDIVVHWFESTFGCVMSNQPFHPTSKQVAHALAVWTTLQLNHSDYNRPFEVTFATPDNVASAGLSKLSLTIPPVAVARLLQDMRDHTPDTREQEEELPILRALECFIFETYHIRIESCTLIRATSAAMLGCDGRCKPLERKLLERVLSEIESMIQSQVRIRPDEPLDESGEEKTAVDAS